MAAFGKMTSTTQTPRFLGSAQRELERAKTRRTRRRVWATAPRHASSNPWVLNRRVRQFSVTVRTTFVGGTARNLSLDLNTDLNLGAHEPGKVLHHLLSDVDGKPVQGVELSAKRQTVFRLTGDGQVAALMPGEDGEGVSVEPDGQKARLPSPSPAPSGDEEIEFNPDDL